MPANIKMPRLDRHMAEGTVVEWLKVDGDEVEEGEPLVVVETEKVTEEVEASTSGVFYRVHPEGAVVPPGEVIGHIFQPGEEVKITPRATRPPERVKAIEAPSPLRAVEVRGRPVASPVAKRLAREHGVDLTPITGTGPDGMITKEDVLTYVDRLKTAEAIPAPAMLGEEEVLPLRGWRKTMAERMALSKRTAAHITTIAEVDMTELRNLRKELDRSEDLAKRGISYTAFIVKAVAQALQKYPILNSSLIDDKIVVKKYYNIGVAVSREKGLVVPVIRNADQKTLFEVSESIKDLADRARSGKLRLEDVRGGTFSITNVGMLGTILNTPIINPPESAILGVGAIKKRPVVVNDQIAIRSMMYLCLTYDHRIIDGAPAIRFLQEVRRLLENPPLLLS